MGAAADCDAAKEEPETRQDQQQAAAGRVGLRGGAELCPAESGGGGGELS